MEYVRKLVHNSCYAYIHKKKKTIENIIELRVPHKDGVQIEAVNKKKICGFETR